MALSDLDIKTEYQNLNSDVAREFYIPILSQAVLYKRAVGFFASNVLYDIATGLTGLVKNGGKIRMIVSPKLNDEDIQSIQLGYRLREEVVADAMLRELVIPITEPEKKKLNLLANLIAENVLDIKVAFKKEADSSGIFHWKIGIVEDYYGQKVAFTGSMNETYAGFHLNYETIDVFCSWRPEDEERVYSKEKSFDTLWANNDPSMCILDFPQVALERLNEYKDLKTEELIDDESVNSTISQPCISTKKHFFCVPDDITLEYYQKDAILAWKEHNFRGIFDMATGTGKTYTALGALSFLSELKKDKLAVFIVCPYQHLIEQWVDDIRRFGVEPIICYSKYDWKKRLSRKVEDFKYKIISNFCAITTNATFALNDMRQIVGSLKGDCCIVVDEAHNFGAKKQIECMSEVFNYRLALSATLDRYGDEYGTRRLYDYFGDKCIEYTLKQAIEEGKLTPYYYYPIPIALNEQELNNYIEITDKIVNILRKVPREDDIPKSAERLLIKRARIVAGAKEKIPALVKEIKPYKDKNHILIYCGAARVDISTDDNNEVDIDDRRQIDEVCNQLGNGLNMVVTKFTSEESPDERETIKKEFYAGNLQALVAIKCLDEGMNIPGIDTAFILASSTNPKEYIQRRGRVLRKAPGKSFARIYDFITLPRGVEEYTQFNTRQAELSLVRREIERMRDFQAISENPSDVSKLIEILTEKYDMLNLGEEYERI